MVDTGGGALRCRPFFSQRAAPPSPSITDSFRGPQDELHAAARPVDPDSEAATAL